jgi:hypothetical protein
VICVLLSASRLVAMHRAAGGFGHIRSKARARGSASVPDKPERPEKNMIGALSFIKKESKRYNLEEQESRHWGKPAKQKNKMGACTRRQTTNTLKTEQKLTITRR